MAKRDEYENVGKGWCGVTTITARGDHKGIGLKPGERILLTQEEKIATANGPRDPANNPFMPGGENGLVLKRIRADVDRTNHRPLGPEDVPAEPQSTAPPEASGAEATPPPPEGAPPAPPESASAGVPTAT